LISEFKEADDRGLWRGAIVDSFLIDFYIPFLPLEKSHVKMCIRDQLRAEMASFANPEQYMRDHFDPDVDSIADQMIYEPPGLQKFSTAGCKRVSNLVKSLIVMRKYPMKSEL